jgi:hypothetical protein
VFDAERRQARSAAPRRGSGHVDCSIADHLRRSNVVAPILLALVGAAPPDRGDDDRARGELLHQLVERERLPTLLAPEIVRAAADGSTSAPSKSHLDCVDATHDITLDPTTGKTDASLELRVKAVEGALPAINFSIDEGLTAGKVTATGHAVDVDDDVFSPTRVVSVHLDPPLAVGEETVLTIPYSGTLSCKPSPAGTHTCSKGSDFSYFAHQSIFPFIFDPATPSSFTYDGLTRKIVLHVPSSEDVFVTGEKATETVDGDTKTSTWTIDKPLSRIVGMYALIGKLGKLHVEGRSVPTTFVFPKPEQDIDHDLVAWSSPALDFVEETTGRALPFDRGLSLVRLPKAIGDPGTATFGMTLLSDSYSRMGELLYEETWAHENTHLFWGIVVPETNSKESRLMSEGMATLTELEYTYARHFAEQDHDLYLARRFLPIALDIRAQAKDVPPIRVAPGAELNNDFRGPTYMLWAYYKTSAALDHLRVTLGEDVFTKAIASYLDRCQFVGCSPDALRDAASEASGKDMAPFFARWIDASERPRVEIGFTPDGSGADVELRKTDERPMTLELWIGTADGARRKQRVDLDGSSTHVHLDSPTTVTTVAASPRHDALVDARSAVEGDLDFDGETDGFDILRCARSVGRSYTSNGATGLWNVSETFDPRCDLNDDFSIDDADLALLTAQFGKLRAR